MAPFACCPTGHSATSRALDSQLRRAAILGDEPLHLRWLRREVIAKSEADTGDLLLPP
jgi:hypothetical protein